MDEDYQDTRTGAAKITEEVFNSTLHGLGAFAGIIGLIFGILHSSSSSQGKIGFIIYGVSLILLMTMSSLYHALVFSKAKQVFQILDHSAIFLLIAGSYTPITIFLYDGWQRYALLSAIWSFAITCVVLSAALPNLMKRFGVGLYIGFGWLAILFIPRFSSLSGSSARLIIIGGVLYTAGAIIMAFKKPFTHTGWHLLVVLAATSHYFAILPLINI
jgi:hemolysin III